MFYLCEHGDHAVFVTDVKGLQPRYRNRTVSPLLKALLSIANALGTASGRARNGFNTFMLLTLSDSLYLFPMPILRLPLRSLGHHRR